MRRNCANNRERLLRYVHALVKIGQVRGHVLRLRVGREQVLPHDLDLFAIGRPAALRKEVHRLVPVGVDDLAGEHGLGAGTLRAHDLQQREQLERVALRTRQNGAASELEPQQH